MFTLSSSHFHVASLSLTLYGEPQLSTIHRNTFWPLNTHYLPKNLLGEVMSPAYLRKNIR
jgi:hypothetical protein